MTLDAWTRASRVPPLADGEVHVWRIVLGDLHADVPRLRAWLSADEIERADRFKFDRHRVDFVAGRAAMRLLLGAYFDATPATLHFSYGERGKPSLPALDFNLSHSGGLALLAVARSRAVGVDVEQVRPEVDTEGIARRFFSAVEVEALLGLPEPERVDAFFRCWTRKEAYIKACGEGLWLALDKFDVTLGPDEPAAFRSSRGDVSGWRMLDVRPGPGWFAALVVSGHDWTARGFDFHWET